MYVTKDAVVVVSAVVVSAAVVGAAVVGAAVVVVVVVVVVDTADAVVDAGAGAGVVATPPDTCSQHDANVTTPYQQLVSPPAP